MNVSQIALSRHTCKDYDQGRIIPAALIEQLKILLRFAPSSVNSQPWHFIIASSPEAKARVARSASEGAYTSNGPKIMKASHVIVFCVRNRLDDRYVARLLEQEAMDGRFATEEARAAQSKGRNYYIQRHRFDRKDTQCWMEKQVYLALGTLLFGAAALEIDATPIEGFDADRLDLELDLHSREMTSVVLAALGYRGRDDFNACLPKSRLPEASVISEI